MDLIQIASKLFMDKVGGGNLDIASVMAGLKGLLPTKGGELDLEGLVAKFTSQGGSIAALAASWLGDGANAGLSTSSILDIFGESKVSDFAGKVGVSTEKAAGGLADIIPVLIDKGSEGGSLVQNVSSMLGKKLLGSLF